jgi:chaperonin cofactor prefoldin
MAGERLYHEFWSSTVTEPRDLIPTLLRDMREHMDRRFDAMDKRFDASDERMDKLEKGLASVRQALAGESLLGRYAVAEVDERLDALEKRIAKLEKRV